MLHLRSDRGTSASSLFIYLYLIVHHSLTYCQGRAAAPRGGATRRVGRQAATGLYIPYAMDTPFDLDLVGDHDSQVIPRSKVGNCIFLE